MMIVFVSIWGRIAAVKSNFRHRSHHHENRTVPMPTKKIAEVDAMTTTPTRRLPVPVHQTEIWPQSPEWPQLMKNGSAYSITDYSATTSTSQ